MDSARAQPHTSDREQDRLGTRTREAIGSAQKLENSVCKAAPLPAYWPSDCEVPCMHAFCHNGLRAREDKTMEAEFGRQGKDDLARAGYKPIKRDSLIGRGSCDGMDGLRRNWFSSCALPICLFFSVGVCGDIL